MLVLIMALVLVSLALVFVIGYPLIRLGGKTEWSCTFGRLQLRLKRMKPPPVETPEQLIADLEKDAKAVLREITHLLGHRRMYEYVTDMVQRNKKLQVPSSFYDWMLRQYGTYLAVGMRRLIDDDNRSASFRNILGKMMTHCHLFTADRHAKFYEKTAMGREVGLSEFEDYSEPGATVIEKRMVDRDLQRIQAAVAPIKAFVDKAIAHSDKGGAQKITFKELHEALDTLRDIAEKYHIIILCTGGDLTPTHIDDWHAIFRVAWDPPEEEPAPAV